MRTTSERFVSTIITHRGRVHTRQHLLLRPSTHRCRVVLPTCEPSASPFPLAPAAHLGVRDQLLRFWTSCGIRSHGSHRQARFSSRFFASTSSRFRLGNGGKWMGEPNTSRHRSEERSNRKEGVERGKRPMVQSSPPFRKGWETRTQPEGMRGDRDVQRMISISEGKYRWSDRKISMARTDRWACTKSIPTQPPGP